MATVWDRKTGCKMVASALYLSEQLLPQQLVFWATDTESLGFLENNKKKKHPCKGLLSEIGLNLLDTHDLLDVVPDPNGKNWMEKSKAILYLVINYTHVGSDVLCNHGERLRAAHVFEFGTLH